MDTICEALSHLFVVCYESLRSNWTIEPFTHNVFQINYESNNNQQQSWGILSVVVFGCYRPCSIFAPSLSTNTEHLCMNWSDIFLKFILRIVQNIVNYVIELSMGNRRTSSPSESKRNWLITTNCPYHALQLTLPHCRRLASEFCGWQQPVLWLQTGLGYVLDTVKIRTSKKNMLKWIGKCWPAYTTFSLHS